MNLLSLTQRQECSLGIWMELCEANTNTLQTEAASSASPLLAYLLDALLLPALPDLHSCPSGPESRQCGDDVPMAQCQQQQACVSPSSCISMLTPLSGDMVDEGQCLQNRCFFGL